MSFRKKKRQFLVYAVFHEKERFEHGRRDALERFTLFFLQIYKYLYFLINNEYDFINIYKTDSFGLTHALELTKALGITQQDIAYKVKVYKYLYFVTNNEYEIINICKNDSFGLTHALELTKLHHEKLIVVRGNFHNCGKYFTECLISSEHSHFGLPLGLLLYRLTRSIPDGVSS